MSAQIFEIAIKESLKNYELKKDGNSLENLYLYHDTEENELIIYDDKNFLLNKVQLLDERTFNIVYTLRQVLHQAGKERIFEKNYISKPFTVSLVDKDFAVLEELFFLDDDVFKRQDSIWRNIEKDLDEFIENLLK